MPGRLKRFDDRVSPSFNTGFAARLDWSIEVLVSMDHNEAIKEMAAERYLLNELTPELRDDFEEHAFGCPECALDLRAGSTFINIAKGELPELVAASPAPSQAEPARPIKKTFDWHSWLRPAFASSRLCRIAGACFVPESLYHPLPAQGRERT